MPKVSRSRLSLRIIGEELDPRQVTTMVGCEPTDSYSKGEELVGNKTGRVRIAPFGFWSIKAEQKKPADLDSQIGELFDQLTDDLSVWADLTEQFSVDLFVGLFMDAENEGCSLSSASAVAVGERGLAIQFDIYDGRD